MVAQVISNPINPNTGQPEPTIERYDVLKSKFGKRNGSKWIAVEIVAPERLLHRAVKGTVSDHQHDQRQNVHKVNPMMAYVHYGQGCPPRQILITRGVAYRLCSQYHFTVERYDRKAEGYKGTGKLIVHLNAQRTKASNRFEQTRLGLKID